MSSRPASFENEELRAERALKPNCALCGQGGRPLYSGLEDRLFSAEGSWDSRKCSNTNCGLIWLDPPPLKEEIAKAYENYYTHSADLTEKIGLRKRIRNLTQRGYWASQYGYQMGLHPLAVGLGKLLYLSPIHRREADADVRFLCAVPQGRLLDVGCGSGEWLQRMRDLGWQAEGVDFDQNAVARAASRQLSVKYGSLEDQKYPANSFDAITLSHVIEHVPDPVATLSECNRILKPGGKLVLFTPNNSSLSHRIFKDSWRGLEPPRHLHVFSMGSTRRALAQAGFEKYSVLPFIVTSIIYESFLLWRGGTGVGKRSRNWPAWLFTRFFKLLELGFINWRGELGDCVIGIAVKE